MGGVGCWSTIPIELDSVRIPGRSGNGTTRCTPRASPRQAPRLEEAVERLDGEQLVAKSASVGFDPGFCQGSGLDGRTPVEADTEPWTCSGNGLDCRRGGPAGSWASLAQGGASGRPKWTQTGSWPGCAASRNVFAAGGIAVLVWSWPKRSSGEPQEEQYLCREEGLRVPPKRRNRLRVGDSTTSASQLEAGDPNQVWAIDYPFDVKAAYRTLKFLHTVDDSPESRSRTPSAAPPRRAGRLDSGVGHYHYGTIGFGL